MKTLINSHQSHWMLVANIVPPVAMWVVAVQIARSYGPEALGLFAIANAIVTPIILVMQLPMRTLHVTAADASTDFGHLLGIRVVMLAIAMVLIACIGSQAVSGEQGILTLLGLALFRACDSYCDLIHATLQREDKIAKIGSLVLARNLVVISVVLFLAQMGLRLEVVVLAMAVGSVMTSAFLDTAVAQRTSNLWRLRMEPRMWRSYAPRLVPLSAVQGLNALAGNVPRYVVQWFGGSHLLGIYSVLEHLALVTSTLVNALGQSMMARMARKWNAGDVESFRASAMNLLAASLASSGVIALALTLFGSTILASLYGSAFAGAQIHVHEASLTAMAMAAVSALGYALTASGAIRQQIGVAVLTLLITTLAATAALPTMGLSGIFLALGLVAAIQSVLFGAQLTLRLRSQSRDA